MNLDPNILHCRRCGKKRISLLGKSTNIFVSSSKYGCGEVSLPNPICRQCFNEFGDWWYKYIHNGVKA